MTYINRRWCGIKLWYWSFEKILSTPSFGGEVKPLVPCRRFAACKRSLNLRWSRNLGKITGHIIRPQFHLSLLGSLASLWTYRHLAAKVGTSKGGGKQWQTIPQELAQDAVCQSHTGHMTGLWFLPTRPLRLNTNEWMNEWIGALNGLWVNPKCEHDKTPCPAKTKLPYLSRHVRLYRATHTALKISEFMTDRFTWRSDRKYKVNQ